MGVYAFIAGVIAIVAAFLFGKKSTTTRIKGDVTIERQRADVAEQKANLSQDVSETVAEVAQTQADAKAELAEVTGELTAAKVQHDPNAAFRVAEKLAEIAQRLL